MSSPKAKRRKAHVKLKNTITFNEKRTREKKNYKKAIDAININVQITISLASKMNLYSKQ